MLIKLFRMHKTIGDVWEPMETSNSDPKGAVLNAKNRRFGLGPIESGNSGPDVAVLHEKQQKRAGTHRDW